MKFESIAAVLTLIGGVIAGVSGFIKLVYSNLGGFKSQKRNKLVKIIEETKNFEVDQQFRSTLLEKYQQYAIYEITGINLKAHQYEIITQTECLKNYSDKTIKRISEFFDYENETLAIKFSRADTRIYRFTMVFSLLLFMLGIATYILAFTAVIFSADFWLLLLAGVAFGILGFVFQTWIVLPYSIAKRIRTQMEENVKIKSAVSTKELEVQKN